MKFITDKNSINLMSNPGRYRDALFPNLHLWTKKNGHQYWIYRFMINGDRKDMSLGPFIAH